MNTLKGIFDNPRPVYRKNFIQENVRQLRNMQKCWNNKDIDVGLPPKPNKFRHITPKVPTHITIYMPRPHDAPTTHENGIVQGARNCTKSSTSAQLVNNHTGPNQRPFAKNIGKKPPPQQESIIKEAVPEEGAALGGAQKQLETSALPSLAGDPGASSSSGFSYSRSASDMEGLSGPTSKDCLMPQSLTVHIQAHQRRPAHLSAQSVRTLGCQTVPLTDLDKIVNEGVIKYPSTSKGSVRSTTPILETAPTCDTSQQTEGVASSRAAVATMPVGQSVSAASSHSLPLQPPPAKKEVASAVQLNKVQRSTSTVPLVQPLSSPNSQQVEGRSSVKGRRVQSAQCANSTAHEQMLQRLKGMRSPGPRKAPGPSPTLSGIRRRFPTKLGREKENTVQLINLKEPEAIPLEIPDPSCPPGHVPLPEVERKETLRMLRKSYADLIRELNMLPVRTDTLKMRQRKMDLERQLNKLEEGIKVFSRPKVFVKIGA